MNADLKALLRATKCGDSFAQAMLIDYLQETNEQERANLQRWQRGERGFHCPLPEFKPEEFVPFAELAWRMYPQGFFVQACVSMHNPPEPEWFAPLGEWLAHLIVIRVGRKQQDLAAFVAALQEYASFTVEAHS